MFSKLKFSVFHSKKISIPFSISFHVQHRETNAIPSTQEGNEAVLIKDEISEFWCMKF